MLAEILKGGGLAVIPTDTLYGLVGRADKPETVARIYQVKQRTPDNPFIILVADQGDLARFGFSLSPALEQTLTELWPGPVSVIIPYPSEQAAAPFAYLHRGTRSLAFRQPANPWLTDLLRMTGPLVAPSANPEGWPPAETLAAARAYFGQQVDYYSPEERTIAGSPSTLVLTRPDGQVKIIRSGAARIPDHLLYS